jgi:hypothetical protein
MNDRADEERRILDHGLAQLQSALRALALPYDQQKEALPSFVALADELALEFDHWWQVVACRATRQEIPPDADGLLKRIARQLAEMSERHDPELWSDMSVQARAEWATLREVAFETLRALGWELGKPVFTSRYVPSR